MMLTSTYLTQEELAELLGISVDELAPYALNESKVVAQLTKYTYYFPTIEDFSALEADIKLAYTLAIAYQFKHMLDNAIMFTPAEALQGVNIGRTTVQAISSDAVAKFNKLSPDAANVLDINGLVVEEVIV